MLVKLFGDRTPIDWQALGVKLPFAPMHELAKKYELEFPYLGAAIPERNNSVVQDICRTFEISKLTFPQDIELIQRINHRVQNTITTLDQATPDTICINLGGGYHHGKKYPKDGYAYSLINDIIWAVDRQLEQGKTVGIIDLDFHFGGGTYEYYAENPHVFIQDQHHPKGVLHKHEGLTYAYTDELTVIPYVQPVDKIILNLGTDWFHDDPVFGKYGNMLSHDILVVWMETIQQIVDRKIPLCITMGGGYGSDGLSLYEHLIEWLTFYEPQDVRTS